MKSIFISFMVILSTALSAQASDVSIGCEADVFTSVNDLFVLSLNARGGSSISYLEDSSEKFQYIPVDVTVDIDKFTFWVYSVATESGLIRMKIDLNAEEDKMISRYKTIDDMEKDTPFDVLGTCYFTL